MVSYVSQVREEQIVRICLYVYVRVAPPMIVGVWSMAVSIIVINIIGRFTMWSLSLILHLHCGDETIKSNLLGQGSD